MLCFCWFDDDFQVDATDDTIETAWLPSWLASPNPQVLE